MAKLSEFVVRLLLALAVLGSMASASAAIDKDYLGTWARTGTTCEDDQVMHITGDGLSGHEFLCTTKSTKRDKNGWRLKLACSAEGTSYSLQLRWRLLKNGNLRETIDGKTAEYARCTKRAAKQSNQSNPDSFAAECVACFNEAQQLVKSVGGYCRPDCVPVFETMTCDSKGICHLPN